MGGNSRRCGRQRQPQVFRVEPGPQPERSHEDRLAHPVDLPEGRPVGIRWNVFVLIDPGVEDFTDDTVDRTAGHACHSRRRANHEQRQKDDPATGQVGLVECVGIDGPLRQGKLVEREAAECPADVLLAIPAHQLGDLKTKPGLDRGVALGVIGQEIDRGELHRLQELAGFRPPGFDAGLCDSSLAGARR